MISERLLQGFESAGDFNAMHRLARLMILHTIALLAYLNNPQWAWP